MRYITPIGIFATGGQVPVAADSEAMIDRKPVQIASFEPANYPPRILLILDSSASVAFKPLLWHAYLSLLSRLIEDMPPSSVAAFATFADRPVLLLPFTGNHAELQNKMKQLDTAVTGQYLPRRSALWDALSSGISDFGPHQEGDAILVLTDGSDNASNRTKQDVAKALKAEDIKLHFLSIENPDEFDSGHESLDVSHLRDFALSLGGTFEEVRQEKRAHFFGQTGKDSVAGDTLGAILTPHFYRITMDTSQKLVIRQNSSLSIRVNNVGFEIDYELPTGVCADQSAVH